MTVYRIVRWLVTLAFSLMARVEITGLENVPRQGGCILAANHLGRLDVPLILYTLPRHDLILIVAEKYRQVALYRYLARKMDVLFVDRYEADFATVRTVLRRLQTGQIFVVAPEGTRSPTESLLPGRPGAVYLAARSGVPILPVAVTGTQDRLVKQKLRHLRRLHIQVRIGEAYRIPPLPRTDRETWLNDMTTDMMCRIAALLPPAYRGKYADCPAAPESTLQKR
ncbi:MAG: lysophospholipid acyltransferase family protein [Anaerolineales bacterium]